MSDIIYTDPVKLTMTERINQLRKEKKWGMEDVERMTGISKSTQQRYETNPLIYIPYQNLMSLAKLYDVSMDYMCGLTLHRKYREMPIDELNLTDGSVEFLKSNQNVRILNELLSCNSFTDLLTATEVFVAGKLTAGANDMNTVFAIAEQALKSKFSLSNQDEVLTFLNQAKVNENEYLRFRITERFNTILKDIYEERKRYEEENSISVSEIMRENLEEFLNDKTAKDRNALDYVAKAIGINITTLSNEKLEVLFEVIKESDLYKMANNQATTNMSREQKRKMKRLTDKKS